MTLPQTVKFQLTLAIASITLLSFHAHASEWVSFPENFHWCVATSSHQIEGYNSNSDWWDWEQQAGHIRNSEISGAATDHWNRVGEDIALMTELGVDTYRFSVEWAKIEPQEGEYDWNAINHYRAEVAALQANGIEPLITLQHFTLPRWVRQKGAWEWSGMSKAFKSFTQIVYTQIAPHVRDWVTINEPMVMIFGGYLKGIMPPGEKRSLSGLIPVMRGILRAHTEAYHELHKLAGAYGRHIRVGIAHHLRTMDPANAYNPLDVIAASLAEPAWNWALSDAATTGRFKFQVLWMANADEEIPGLAGTQDFIGVNYYSGDLVHFTYDNPMQMETRPALTKNDLGWDIYPEGFYRVLRSVSAHFPGLPVIITENGIADSQDALRPAFIKSHLFQLARAIADGVPVEAYCHWSLLDNFEWAEGFAPRFGLYATDYRSFARTPRGSARLFQQITQANGFYR